MNNYSVDRLLTDSALMRRFISDLWENGLLNVSLGETAYDGDYYPGPRGYMKGRILILDDHTPTILVTSEEGATLEGNNMRAVATKGCLITVWTGRWIIDGPWVKSVEHLLEELISELEPLMQKQEEEALQHKLQMEQNLRDSWK